MSCCKGDMGASLIMMSSHLLAKVEQQTLKDEDRAGAAQDGERLAGQQAEHRT